MCLPRNRPRQRRIRTHPQALVIRVVRYVNALLLRTGMGTFRRVFAILDNHIAGRIELRRMIHGIIGLIRDHVDLVHEFNVLMAVGNRIVVDNEGSIHLHENSGDVVVCEFTESNMQSPYFGSS